MTYLKSAQPLFMLADRRLNYKKFTIAALASSLLAGVLLSCSFYLGKKEFFLLLNNDLGRVADVFFNYATYLGDGTLWVIWLIVLFAKKRRHLLPLVITAFVSTTVLVQVCKQVILPNESRPAEVIPHELIHFIQGITVHSINSFPSGHTATAFSFALMIALLTRSTVLMIGSILIAALVGYTRIYQAQHFPLDVGAGILVAVASVTIAALVQKRYDAKRKQRMEQTREDISRGEVE